MYSLQSYSLQSDLCRASDFKGVGLKKKGKEELDVFPGDSSLRYCLCLSSQYSISRCEYPLLHAIVVLCAQVRAIEEEEYCLIPMGGVLPAHPQRVLGVGGTAGMVHPSTGFMMSRMLGAVPVIADGIIEQLTSTQSTDGVPTCDGMLPHCDSPPSLDLLMAYRTFM